MREGAKAPRRLYQGDCLVRPEHVLARVLLAFDCEGPDSFNIEAGLIVEGAVVVAET